MKRRRGAEPCGLKVGLAPLVPGLLRGDSPSSHYMGATRMGVGAQRSEEVTEEYWRSYSKGSFVPPPPPVLSATGVYLGWNRKKQEKFLVLRVPQTQHCYLPHTPVQPSSCTPGGQTPESRDSLAKRPTTHCRSLSLQPPSKVPLGSVCV